MDVSLPFLGAAHCVTGSNYLLTVESGSAAKHQIRGDCGLGVWRGLGMNARGRLLPIKLAYPLVWAFLVAAIGYVVYSEMADKITAYPWVASGLVGAAGVMLRLFSRRCPLTIPARNYSHSHRANFDIFLPDWLTRHNQVAFTFIYGLGLLLLAYRLGQHP